MAIPTGGLNQVSAQQKPTAPVQAGGKFDTSAVQAENLEEISKSKPSLKDVVSDELGDQREKMNSALLRMRESLDARKNRMFDPVLMQTAAGFLKKTKSGSFGESLGNAAENAGAAAEREMLHEKENQKLEMELLGKEQELRRQMGGDQFMSALFGGSPVSAPAAGGAKPTGNFSPISAAGVPAGSAVPTAGSAQNPPSKQQVLNAAIDGQIKITDQVIALADAIDPKKATLLREIRNIQIAQEKNDIAQKEFDFKTSSEKRKVIPRGLRTEREMNAGEYAKYEAAKAQFFDDGDENKLLDFYDRMGWLESDQVRNRKITPKSAEGTTPDDGTAPAKSAIPRAQSAAEVKANEEALSKTASIRAEDAEKAASRLVSSGRVAFANSNTADDMIGYATNNPRVFEIMNKPGIAGSIARAAKEGLTSGNFTVNIPSDKILDYKLTAEDLTALQMFAQKSSELQTRGRQLNRTPGEGSMSDFETKLLGGIYALPSDSQRAVILKSQALKAQGAFDRAAAEIWIRKSKEPGYGYNDFLLDKDHLALQKDYEQTLKDMRESNLDLLSPKRKSKAAPAASAPASSPEPSATPSKATPPANESPLERFKREKAEREKKAQGNS